MWGGILSKCTHCHFNSEEIVKKNPMHNSLLHVFMWLLIYSYTQKQILNTPLRTSTAHLRFQRSASQYISSAMHVSVICICRMPCKVSVPILPLLEMLMPHLFGSVPLSRGPQHVGLTANTVVAPCPRPPSPSSPSSLPLSLALFSWGSQVSQELDETIESQRPDTTCHTQCNSSSVL